MDQNPDDKMATPEQTALFLSLVTAHMRPGTIEKLMERLETNDVVDASDEPEPDAPVPPPV